MPWFVLVVAFALQGCEKPSHENIERWYKTEKGPKKLEKALKNPDLDPDLRGHAAEQLILLDKAKEVLRVIEGMGTCLLYTSPSPRDQRGSRMPSSA